MNPHFSITKVEMIERSLRCFFFGVLGFLPFIGLPMSIIASRDYRRVTAAQGALWNPAGPYLLWGGICARLSLFLLIPWTIIIIVIIRG